MDQQQEAPDRLTTEEVADLLYPPTQKEQDAPEADRKRKRRSRLRSTNTALKQRAGISPLPGRTDDGQRLWPREEVMAWLDSRPGSGRWGRRAQGGVTLKAE